MTLMENAAEKAARVLVRDFGEVEQLQVSQKGPSDFVTAADRRSEEIIFEELKKARPDYSFMMEESGEVKGQDHENIWIIDPIDGTHNFMHGIPHWCISIALESKGKILAGLIYDPIKDEIFQAERGIGAFMRRKRLRVSGRQDLSSSTIAMGNPTADPKKRAQQLKEYEAVTAKAPMIRRMAAAALDLSYVAAGRLDGFWERDCKPWDIAAGYIILKEAGGFITSIDNDDNPIYSQNLVCGNQYVHSELKKILTSVS